MMLLLLCGERRCLMVLGELSGVVDAEMMEKLLVNDVRN